jgi:predicted HTH transcriptional regulator
MNLGKENEYQEFKESLGLLDKGLKSISAMLNNHGEATVYFGVKDNGDVCGLTIGKDTSMDIRNRIRDKIEPIIYPKIEECADGKKSFLKITAKGSDVPYSFDGRYYIRVVSADEQADNAVLRKMLVSSDADIIKQKEAPNQQLKFKNFFALLASNGIQPDLSEDFLGNYGLINNEGKLNINAYLLSDDNDIRINVITFEGKDKSVMSRRTEYGNKCILTAIDEVLKYFEIINTTDVDVTGIKRNERQLFDQASFREAWINACLHNDWNNMLPPAIYVYDDRMEIISYGGLPYSLSIDGFFNGKSIPVNKSLLTIFIAAGYAEQSGHGVPTIVAKYGKEAFSFSDGMVSVTIPFKHVPDYVMRRNDLSVRKTDLNSNQKKVYETLKLDGNLSLQEVADKCGLSLSGVKKICSMLQKYGFVERIGSKRDGHWAVK